MEKKRILSAVNWSDHLPPAKDFHVIDGQLHYVEHKKAGTEDPEKRVSESTLHYSVMPMHVPARLHIHN